MKLLVADDENVQRLLISKFFKEFGYDVVECSDGNEAWNVMQKEDSPNLIVLDWVMPGISGIELCRKAREMAKGQYFYILLVTAKTDAEDLIEGMEAGADDYIFKPFNKQELGVRLRAGKRIVELNEELLKTQDSLQERNKNLSDKNDELARLNYDLQNAMGEIKVLKGLLPICANCKKIRTDNDNPNNQKSWDHIETYIRGRTDAEFTHTICPECRIKLYPQLYNKI